MPANIQKFPPHDDAVDLVIAKKLKESCIAQFGAVNQAGAGIGQKSCCAAVAIVPVNGYPDIASGTALSFAAVYGNSQIIVRGLDADAPFDANRDKQPFSQSSREEHAEQCAILTAAKQGLTFFTANRSFHLYVQLQPCSGCDPWLQKRQENWKVYWG